MATSSFTKRVVVPNDEVADRLIKILDEKSAYKAPKQNVIKQIERSEQVLAKLLRR